MPATIADAAPPGKPNVLIGSQLPRTAEPSIAIPGTLGAQRELGPCKTGNTVPVLRMANEIKTVIQIAMEEFNKLLPHGMATGVEVEEVEEQAGTGRYYVTLGYWVRDTKPVPDLAGPGSRSIPDLPPLKSSRTPSLSADLINPWRRKYKRVEIDPIQGKAIAIRMYEPPLGVS